MDKFLALLKPMLNKEIAENLKTYQTVEELAELMPLELLPSNYKGGKEDSIEKLWGKAYIRPSTSSGSNLNLNHF